MLRIPAPFGRIATRGLPAAAAVSMLALAAPGAPAAVQQAGAVAQPLLSGPILTGKQLPAPISTTDCQADIGISCYTPVQYRVHYNLNPLYRHGVTGRGETIVIVDSYGSPTIRHDLRVFDKQFGFPNPDLRIVRFGNIPPFDSTNSTMVGWALETTLDVEYAHSIAPGAKIVLAETSVAETEGVTGFPEMMSAEASLINAGVGDVISQSFGATENTFPGFSSGNYSSLLDLRYAYKDALAHHVTVLGGSGDTGATNYEADGATLYPYRVNSWPSSDPLVTSVGGSQLYLDNAGNQLQPDSVWNDAYGAGGGGVSAVFSRPLYQAAVRNVVGSHRGTPDISMSAAVNGACWVYLSFAGAETSGVDNPGWYLVGGTSEATPIFSGIVALADQVAGHRLGLINPALYALGWASEHGASNTGLVDITAGNNSFAGVTGYDTGPGYDLASGWGTIDAAKFVPALARAAGELPDAGSWAVSAAQEPAGELRYPGRPAGPGFLAVGPAHRAQPGVRAQPAQWFRLPFRGPVPDPGQPGDLGVLAQHQIGQRAPGQVGGGHPVTDIAAAQPRPVARSSPADAHQSRGTPSGPPQVCVTGTSPRAGNSSPSVWRSAANTAGTWSNSGRMAEPKWYGAPRPPNASRPSAVRWP